MGSFKEERGHLCVGSVNSKAIRPEEHCRKPVACPSPPPSKRCTELRITIYVQVKTFTVIIQRQINNTFTRRLSSPGIPGHGLRLHGKHQTESCSNEAQGLKDATQFDRIHDTTSKTTRSPGKMKMKKALIPPMTLMTLLMSGTNVAISSVAAIHRTVST